MESPESILQAALAEDNPLIRALAQVALSRLAAGAKLNEAKASRSEVDMSLVIATAGTIDLDSVCEDPNCAQRGELMRTHHVVHKGKVKKGLRGVCPECQGPMNNLKDDAKLIAFACLWRQTFGEKARKTPVNAVTLAEVVKKIQDGSISKWADRNLMLTILAPKAVAAPATASGTAVPASSAGATTSTAGAAAPPSTGSVPPHAAPVATAKKADPDKQKKLRELLRGAKVTP